MRRQIVREVPSPEYTVLGAENKMKQNGDNLERIVGDSGRIVGCQSGERM